MRILALSPHLPYAGVPHAGGHFLLEHLAAVSRDHDVTLVVPGTAEVLRHLPEAPPWLDLVVTPCGEPRRDLRTQVDRARRLVRFRSLNSPALRGLRDARVADRAGAADIVELHWTDSTIAIRDLQRTGVSTPISVVAYDVDAEASVSRARRLGTPGHRATTALLRSVRARTQKRDLAATDLVLVFKDGDAELLRRLGVPTPTLVVQPPLELPDGPPSERIAPALLFTGAMWRPENHEGVTWFLREVWGRVRAAIPDATFTIAGAGPTPALEAIVAGTGGAVLTGAVTTLKPYYAGATGYVAPLFVAGGLKFKVVQAMAYGLPVVASSIAAAGIADAAPSGTFWAVTDDPVAMADALVRLLRRPQDAAVVGDAAARWCRRHYSFETSTRAVLDAYADLRRTRRTTVR